MNEKREIEHKKKFKKLEINIYTRVYENINIRK